MKNLFFIILLTIGWQINLAQPTLYGVTNYGGAGGGTIFSLTVGNNSVTAVSNLNYYAPGSEPYYTDLIQTSSGRLYGMTYSGGAFGNGIIFEYDTLTNTSTVRHNFDGSINGKGPKGSLVEANNGKLYGMTTAGGTFSVGIIFEFDPVSNVFAKKLDFDGPNFGSTPMNSMVKASNGKLYGMTNIGGSSNSGVLFEFDPISGLFQKKRDLSIGTGGTPYGNLLEAANGKFYGLALGGAAGIFGNGVLFEYDFVSDIYLKKLDFSLTATGSDPYGSLIQSTNGKLYGMTSSGGTSNKGVIFEYDIATDTCIKKFDFNGSITGQFPYGSLLHYQGNGKLYGMTNQGGSNGKGVLFEYDAGTNIFTKKMDFNTLTSGQHPFGSLMLCTNGKLYGLTNSGGANGANGNYAAGVLFEYNPNSNLFVKKLDLTSKLNGINPQGKLTLGSNGLFYGVTIHGGLGQGVFYEYNPLTNVYIKKRDFYLPTGTAPYSNLLHFNNKLYGVAANGGANSKGVIFEYDYLNNIYLTKKDFNGTNGTNPVYGLVLANNSKFYGMTMLGGGSNNGSIFEYNLATNSCISVGGFTNGHISGSNPIGQLLKCSNGKLYGATTQGGVNGLGGLFEFNTTTSFKTKILDFDGIGNGSAPTGFFVEASNGKLYGLTTNGGTYNNGVLFEFDPLSNTYVKKMDFQNVLDGQHPSGGLYLASNEKLYGMTVDGGSYNYGTIFEYEISTNTFTKIFDFNGLNGANPSFATLTEYCSVPLAPTNITPAVNLTPCIFSSTTLSVSSSSQVKWYSSSNSTNVIGYGLSFVTSPLSAGTYTYYAAAFTCIESASRTAITITVNPTCQDVWPGDANSDGAANNLDILELGLHYTQTGAPRATASNTWQSYFANNWTGTITNGKNVNHSDCNGDGTITDDDTLAIYNNYGLTHTFKPAETSTVNTQMSIVPDQSMIVKGMWGTASIYLGSATSNITNINGVAFTVDFDNTLIEPNSIYIEYQNSFIDASQNLYFRKLNFANAKLFTASTHTISNNASGYGKIATLHYQIKSSLTTDEVLNIGLSQANQSDAFGTITPLTTGTGTLMAIGASVGLQSTLMGNMISISPNPTNGLLNVNFNSAQQNIKIELYNSIGALVLTENMNSKINTINLSDLSCGIYFMKVLEGNEIIAVRKVVKE